VYSGQVAEVYSGQVAEVRILAVSGIHSI
jgi:hypothetical protein